MFNPFKKEKPENEDDALKEGTMRADADDQSLHNDPQSVPADPADQHARIAELQADLAQAQAERQRALADYANFQRRSIQNERDAKEAGLRGVLHSVIPVIDHFDMALGQNPEQATTQSVLAGVGMIKDELLRALAVHGVSIIRPSKGDAFDPVRHKAIAQQPSPGVAPGAVAILTRPGFAIGERIVRPAEVVVAPERTEDAQPGT